MKGSELDPERERLLAAYRDLTDSELLELTREPESLTPIAREALRAEISRRGLVLERPSRPETRPEPQLVTIRTFGNLAMQEAIIAQSRLESAGIESHLRNDSMINLWPAITDGIMLQVKAEDAEDALRVIGEPETE